MPNLHHLVTQPSRTGRGTNPSVWRGVVVNLTPNAVWVRAPTLADDDLTATNTIPGDLTPGDRVIIAAVEGRVDNLVVLAKENPSIPAHTHPEGNITYPGWADATLQTPWTPGTGTYYNGLRYRVDSRFIHVNGTITGGTGPSTITELPVTLTHSSPLYALGSTGPVEVTINQTGLIYTEAGGTLRVNGSAPLG